MEGIGRVGIVFFGLYERDKGPQIDTVKNKNINPYR